MQHDVIVHKLHIAGLQFHVVEELAFQQLGV
jgi:hypothetical protein